MLGLAPLGPCQLWLNQRCPWYGTADTVSRDPTRVYGCAAPHYTAKFCQAATHQLRAMPARNRHGARRRARCADTPVHRGRFRRDSSPWAFSTRMIPPPSTCAKAPAASTACSRESRTQACVQPGVRTCQRPSAPRPTRHVPTADHLPARVHDRVHRHRPQRPSATPRARVPLLFMGAAGVRCGWGRRGCSGR